MHPVLFEIFGYPLRTYGFAMAMAFVVDILLVYRRAPIEQQDRQMTLNACLWIIIGTLVGGRLLFAITQWGDFVTEPKRLFSFWEGGLVFYGGFIGSFIAALGYLLWANLSPKDGRKFIWMLVGGTLLFGYVLSGIRVLSGNAIGEGFLSYLGFWNYGLHHSVGFLAAFVVVFVYWSWRTRDEQRHYRLLPITDLLAPYVGLGLAIHRGFGCFMNGCCYGRPTDLPWGVQFPLDHAGTKFFGIEAHLHPTQLYESINGLIIFAALLWLRKRKKAEGEVTGWLLIIYAVNRYLIEFYRGDKLRGEVGEPVSVVLFLIAYTLVVAGMLALLAYVRRRGIAQGTVAPDDPKKVYGFFAAGIAFTFVLTVIGEMLRPDATMAVIGPISTSQFIGYLVIFSGFSLYVIAHYLGHRTVAVT